MDSTKNMLSITLAKAEPGVMWPTLSAPFEPRTLEESRSMLPSEGAVSVLFVFNGSLWGAGISSAEEFDRALAERIQRESLEDDFTDAHAQLELAFSNEDSELALRHLLDSARKGCALAWLILADQSSDDEEQRRIALSMALRVCTGRWDASTVC
jgi:hypothetical protein